MGFFDRLKEIFGMDTNIYESEEAKTHYKECKATILSDIQRFEKYLYNERNKVNEIRKNTKNTNPKLNDAEIDKILLDNKIYKETVMECHRWEYALDIAKMELEFVRPNTSSDIIYRTGVNIWDDSMLGGFNPPKDDIYAHGNIGTFTEKWKHMEFNEKTQKLRFHASPIATTKAIIESGGITSTVDRYDGYYSSTDIAGEISTAPYNELPYSLDFFMGTRDYRRGLPCGCVFAVYPKEGEEISGYCTKNIDFKKNPEQLYAIFTTPENIPNVSKWVEEAGLNVNVYTFEGFLECLQKDFEQEIPTDAEVINAIRKEMKEKEYTEKGPRVEINKEEKIENEELETSDIEDAILNGDLEDVKEIMGDNENTINNLVQDDQIQDL